VVPNQCANRPADARATGGARTVFDLTRDLKEWRLSSHDRRLGDALRLNIER
jgi:hypothetical protein